MSVCDGIIDSSNIIDTMGELVSYESHDLVSSEKIRVQDPGGAPTLHIRPHPRTNQSEYARPVTPGAIPS